MSQTPPMRSALGRVRGHGAGHGGTDHFIGQRLSALALLLLTPWFVVSAALSMPGPSYVAAIDFLSQPVNAVGVILLIGAAIYHMCIGAQEIVEDYITKPLTKTLLLAVNTLLGIALAAAAVFAVLNINFSGV
ncbi:MAG: succinate dehydrogenase, hydrophobic membrane anchor protein [Terricaulis sp.]